MGAAAIADHPADLADTARSTPVASLAKAGSKTPGAQGISLRRVPGVFDSAPPPGVVYSRPAVANLRKRWLCAPHLAVQTPGGLL